MCLFFLTNCPQSGLFKRHKKSNARKGAISINISDEPVFIKTDKRKIDAALYQAIFDEVIRLRKSRRASERESIRCFIVIAYQLLAKYNSENADQNTVLENMPQ